MKNNTNKSRLTKYIAVVGIMSALGFVLMLLEFPLPFLIPSFIKFDFSELPALVTAFAYGPVSGMIVCLVKNVLHLPFTTSNCIGELSNFILGAIFVGLATTVIGRINRQKMDELNEEKDKTEEMLTNTLDISKTISNDIESVSVRMEILKQSVSATRDSMNDVTEGANETAESMQQQLGETTEVMHYIGKARKVTDAITSDVNHTEDTIEKSKKNLSHLLKSVNESENVSEMVGENGVSRVV